MFDTNNKLIIFSCLIAILVSLFSSNILLVLSLILISILIYFYGIKGILSLTIIGYLSAPSDFFGDYRVIINIILTGILLLLSFKEFGFNFREYPRVPNEVLYFLAALFFSILLSTIFSSEHSTGFFTIITMLAFYIISYLFYAFLKYEKNINLYIYSICAAVLILSIRMFLDLYNLGFQEFLIRSLLSENIKLYSSSRYTGSVIFFISATLISAMFFMDRFKKIKNKIILFFLFSINVVILILSNSRGLIIAAFLGISFLAFVFKRTLFLKVLISVVVVFVIVVLSVPEVDDSVNLYLRTGTTHREIFWEAGLEIIGDYPIVGIGPRAFNKYFYTYAPSSVLTIQEWKTGNHTPHNFFLYYAAENGVLGFIAGVSLFILYFYFASQVMKNSKRNNKEYFILSVAIFGIGIGFFVRSFVEVTGFLYYGYITTDLPFWLVFGILISIYQKIKNKEVTILI